MSFLPQTFAFPGILLPAFVAAAVLIAVLLRERRPGAPLRYRDIVVRGALWAAIGCVVLAALWILRNPYHSKLVTGGRSVEVDMTVSKGSTAELYLNDWGHPPESVPVAGGKRQVYRFLKVPQDITLLRLDPSDVPGAHIEIHSIRVMLGDQMAAEFGPPELQGWTLVNLSAPKQENGALVLDSSNDDPILWMGSLSIQFPQAEAPPSWARFYVGPLVLGALGLLPLLLLVVIRGNPRFAAGLLDRPLAGLEPDTLLNRWSLLLVMLMAAGGSLALLKQQAGSGVLLEVDMRVSKGSTMELYLNDWQHPPERLPVVAGERHVYRFHELPQHLRLLRLDPTDQPGAHIVLYSVTVKRGLQVLHRFGPAEIRNWNRSDLSEPQDEGGGVGLSDLTGDPILTTPLDIRLPDNPLAVLVPLFEGGDAPFLLAIGAFLAVLLARMGTVSGRMQALLMAAVCCAALPVVRLVMDMNLLAPPGVRTTVGYASYNGYPKGNEHLASAMVLLVAIGLGWLFAKLAGRAPEGLEAPVVPSRRSHAWIAYGAVCGLVFVYFLPDLLDVLSSMPGLAYQRSNWDDMNWVAWDYMVTKGLRPLRDFWFPYSGAYLQVLPAPAGMLFWTFHYTFVLLTFYVGLFKATGRRVSQALVIFGLIVAPALLGILAAWHRYLLAVNVALFYVAARHARGWEWGTHVPFALLTGFTFFYEPTLILYVMAGIAVDLLLSLSDAWRGGRMAGCLSVLRQRALLVGIPMLAGIAGGVLAFASNGMLAGLLDFERSLGDQGDYGALPSAIANWVRLELQPDSVFLLMFLLVSYVVYRRLRGADSETDRLGTALLVLCGTSFLAMQKQILRPHNMPLLRVIPYVALLIFGLIAWREGKAAVRVAIAAFLGCMLAVGVQRHLPEEVFAKEFVTGPRRIVHSADALLHKGAEFARQSAVLYGPSHFKSFDVENALVAHLTQAGLRRGEKVYVLGDAAVFYILLDQVPPYVANLYNTSPLSEQQRALDWFRREKPRFVIWTSDVSSFDEVPQAVRLPLLYRYVVDHYRFQKAFGGYHVLEEKPQEQAVEVEYWRRSLGSGVDLRRVPSLARESEYEECGADVSRCDAVLVVKYAAAPGARRKVVADIGGFPVSFEAVPERQEYVVNLERLWFWSAVSKPAKITVQDGEAQAAMSYRRERHPVLY